MNPIKHIAIIMDGNGRWGLKHRGSRNSGHKAGLNTVEIIIDECLKKDIKLKFIGELSKLPINLQKLIKLSEKKTIKNKSLQVNIALNYGSKTELINTIKKIKQKKIKINEKNIGKNLYTKHLPDPDILIRTGDTHRLSNFLLWQLSYTEIFFEKKLWPDFKSKDFDKILNKFKNIKRNFGSI